MDFYEEAKKYEEYIRECRRYLHQNAETGFDLIKTRDFVTQQLKGMGYSPVELGGGITCTCGKGEKVLLLRADMDALPQEEATELAFACRDGACHSCGHDMHTAMLLGAARILKENEGMLKGIVKFMFQPAEEILEGAKRMVKAGILEKPKVDAAMGMHITQEKVGTAAYSVGTCAASADAFGITVSGREAHGSMPDMGISALNVAVNIVTALQQMQSLEVKRGNKAVLSICSVQSGDTTNIIPGKAVIQGSIRAYDLESQEFLKTRLVEISQQTGRLWRAETEVRFLMGTDPNINDQKLTGQMAPYISEIIRDVKVTEPVSASEDFAILGRYVPTFYLTLGAADAGGNHYPMHNPKVVYNEDAMAGGAAVWCNCAVKWLAEPATSLSRT